MRWSAVPQPRALPRNPYAHRALERAARLTGAGAPTLVGLLRTVPADEEPLRVDPLPPAGDRAASLPTLVGDDEVAVPILLPPDVTNPTLASASRGGGLHFDDPPLWPDTVLVTVLDAAIAFAHERFRRRIGGRLADAHRPAVAAGGGTRRSGRCAALPYGRDFDAAVIDALFAAHARGAGIDEEALDRDPWRGLVRADGASRRGVLRQASHGTAVLDLAAGLAAADLTGDRLRVLAVSLPPAVVRDTPVSSSKLYLIHAVQRLLEQVEAREAQASAVDGQTAHYLVVVIINLALLNGINDGTGLLERFMAH